MKFINREKELDFLNQTWLDKKTHFIIIYGKRRVGKTELLKQFIKKKKAVYFLADKRSSKDQLKELGRIMGGHFNDLLLIKNGFREWLDVFLYLKEKVSDRFIFVIDEFSYLLEVEKNIGFIFQKGWDEYLKEKNIILVLCGSSISMMEKETLDYRSPLYGRRTGQILLKPLTFYQSWQFFPKKNLNDFLSIYSITGGMPSYLLQIDGDLSIADNLKEKIFKKTAFLYNEVEFFLRDELREVKNYFSILKAISFGKRKFGEIINETGLPKNILMKYLITLTNLQLIEKEIPITEKNPHKSKKGLYRISDNFFRFWFQFVFPYKSELEIENYSQPLINFERKFNILKALIYKEVALEILLNNQDKVFPLEKIGRWWDKQEEIDIVGLNERDKKIIFGEVKWSDKLMDVDVFYKLKDKSKLVNWQNKERKEYFIFFNKAGFTKRFLELAKKEKIFLVKGEKFFSKRKFWDKE